MKNEIILFENQDVKLEVNMQDETVWLSLDQMAKLFDRDKSVISRHIKNALEEELDNSVVAKFATTAKDGKTYQVDYYSLDVIISVGYRVKSKNGVIFRKWANKILKDYLIKGYAVNQKRLEYLEKTIKLIDIAGRIDTELKGSEAQEIIKVTIKNAKAVKKVVWKSSKKSVVILKKKTKKSVQFLPQRKNPPDLLPQVLVYSPVEPR